jgi:nitrogen fixation protein
MECGSRKVRARFARHGVQVYVSVKDRGKPVEQVEYPRSVGCKIIHRRFGVAGGAPQPQTLSAT